MSRRETFMQRIRHSMRRASDLSCGSTGGPVAPPASTSIMLPSSWSCASQRLSSKAATTTSRLPSRRFW